MNIIIKITDVAGDNPGLKVDYKQMDDFPHTGAQFNKFVFSKVVAICREAERLMEQDSLPEEREG